MQNLYFVSNKSSMSNTPRYAHFFFLFFFGPRFWYIFVDFITPLPTIWLALAFKFTITPTNIRFYYLIGSGSGIVQFSISMYKCTGNVQNVHSYTRSNKTRSDAKPTMIFVTIVALILVLLTISLFNLDMFVCLRAYVQTCTVECPHSCYVFVCLSLWCVCV